MKYIVLTAICVTLAAALPAQVERQAYDPCPSEEYSIPLCCTVDDFGYDCLMLTLVLPASDTPTDENDFRTTCQDQRPRCCDFEPVSDIWPN
jgi:hypothetical protein